ncbi:MAG: hypothetical protein ACJ74U_09745 [Jatrophihabitantaceae bacterium]
MLPLRTATGRLGDSHYLRVALIALALILTPLAAGVLAVFLAPPAHVTDVGLDGLDVDVRLVPGGGSTQLDSALLGGLRTKGPTVAGKPIGITVRPSDLNLDLFDSRGALDPATIDVIGHLFGDRQTRQAELRRLAGSVIRYYGTVFCVAAYLVATAEVLGLAYLRRRSEQLHRLASPVPPLLRTEERAVRATAAVLGLALILPAGYLVSPASNHAEAVRPDPQLADTFLAGWQLTGPFSYLIRQAATSIDALSRSEQAFYDQVSANRDAAYARQYGAASLPHDPDIVRIAVLDDLQGTSGMARIVGEAAGRVHADAIVNLGDLTATGTTQEAYLSYLKSYTVQVLAHYSGSIPVYSSLGRHDTPAVAGYARKLHISVADGQPHQVAGIRMIGVNSPYIVNFGDAARLIDPEVTTDSVAAALPTLACAQQPFAVFAHDTELLGPLVQSGCVPLVIGGHSYTGEPSRDVSTPDGTVRQIVLGSTGGHGANDGLGGLSTPRNDAPFVLISIDRKTGEVSVDTTTVHPDGSVSIAGTRLAPLDGTQRARLR